MLGGVGVGSEQQQKGTLGHLGVHRISWDMASFVNKNLE